MKLVDEFIRREKYYVYDLYSRIVFDAKDYDKITRKKMIEEIVDEYKNHSEIFDELISNKERDFLLHLRTLDMDKMEKEYEAIIQEYRSLYGEDYFTYYREINKQSPLTMLIKDYWWEIKELSNKCLLVSNFSDSRLEVPEELVDTVNAFLDREVHSNKKNIEGFSSLAIGFLKVTGELSAEIYIKMLVDMTGMSEDIVKTFVFNSYVGRFYIYKYHEYKYGKNIIMASYWDYYDYIDDLYEAKKGKAHSSNILIDIKAFQKTFLDGFDTTKPYVDEMIKETIRLFPDYNRVLFKSIDEARVLGFDKDEIYNHLSFWIRDASEDEKIAYVDLVSKAINELPSPAYAGLSPKEGKKEDVKRKAYYNRPIVQQRNACLSEKEADDFYRIYFALLEYVNQKYKVVKGLRILGGYSLNPEDIDKVITILWGNKNKIIKEYVKKNPFNLSEKDMGVTKGFIRGIKGMFIIYDFEKDYTLMSDEDYTYMVKGLRSNIDEIIDNDSLPIAVEAVLLPFGDKIVIDGIIKSMPSNIDIPISVIENMDNQHKVYRL